MATDSDSSLLSYSSDSEFSDDTLSDDQGFVEDNEEMTMHDGTETGRLQTITMGIIPYQYEPQADKGNTDSERDLHTVECEDRQERLQNTNWCICDNCNIMTNVQESICCQEIVKVMQKCEEDDPSTCCITSHTDFRAVCLNKGVIDTAYFQYRQQYSTNIKRQDERYRHVAYRQFVRWCWGYLGKEVRRTLPSCAVTLIRATFPAPDGVYSGFKLA